MKRIKKYWKRITVIALSVVAFLTIVFTYLTWNSHDNNYFLNCRWNAVITEPLATMGNADAQNKMGYFCLFECGSCEPTAQHLINAIDWWEKAAAKGDQDAIKQLEWAKVELAKLLSKGQSDCKREAITAKDSNNLTASDAFVIDGKISDGVIQMTKAGQLGLFLTISNLFNTTKLAISGTINASDIGAIKTNLLALEHLDLSATDLKTIAPHSFVSDRLKTITLPQSVTSIEDSAFFGCSSLTSITIPNSVISIGKAAFESCSSLTFITIPNSVISIGEWAFDGCSSLTSVTIPNSVTSIGGAAFSDCSSLTSITIPNSVTSIGRHAFYGCSSLTSITIPKSVTSIGWLIFAGCSSLTSITIPNSVTSIGWRAFSCCSSLTSIAIPNSVKSIEDSAFAGCSSLTSITIPKSVMSIENSVFSGCSSLTSIAIPKSVTSIGERAFFGCSSLTSITIPKSVTSIGGRAFYGCDKAAFTMEHLSPIEYQKLMIPEATAIRVPQSSIDRYKAAEGWKDHQIIGY